MKDRDKRIATDLAYRIIKEVSRTIRPYVGKEESGVTVKIGADGTPTSLIDVIAEDTIINILKKVPIYSYVISEEIGEIKIGKGTVNGIVLSEELQREDLSDDEKASFIFLIDPVDGTTNAIREIPAYAISIAVADVSYGRMSTLDDVELAFISNLADGSFFEAEKGKGCLLRNKEVQPSSIVNMDEMTLGGFIKTNTSSASKLVDTARRMRVLGSVVLELSYVASGKYDSFLDLRGSRIIDIAASKLIIEEAGAIITDKDGEAIHTSLGIHEKTIVVASSNRILHDKIISILNGD
ncbi:inositol monophosphatase family protein [Methanobrevibacter millerae]|uniref:fructose-bisphosphatase n=1 Tax=Methanobrevibacter millerae TaxID=230361 RepID=A0A1G5VW67_9EURY|nr:inositol monophosphatase family protein [Methanobrevibacter millerae]SDA49255.1 myo-inositol-1(or 4)-monophosphatase [Methanobrevibacter millerae]